MTLRTAQQPFRYTIMHSKYHTGEPKPTTKTDFTKFISAYDWAKDFGNYLGLGNEGFDCTPPSIFLEGNRIAVQHNMDGQWVAAYAQVIFHILKTREESDVFSAFYAWNVPGTSSKAWAALNLAEVIKLIDFLFDFKFDEIESYDNDPSQERIAWCNRIPFSCPKYYSFEKDFDYEGAHKRFFAEELYTEPTELMEHLNVRVLLAPDENKSYFAEPNFFMTNGEKPIPLEPGYEIKQLHSTNWSGWEDAYEDYRGQWNEAASKFAVNFPVDVGSGSLAFPKEDVIEDIIEQKIGEAASMAYNKPADDIRPWDKPDWDNIQKEFVDIYPNKPSVSIIHKNVLYYNLQSDWYEPKEELNENIVGPALHLRKPAFRIGEGQVNDLIFEKYKDKFMLIAVIEDLANDKELNILEQGTRVFPSLTVEEVIELCTAFYRLDWDFILNYEEGAD